MKFTTSLLASSALALVASAALAQDVAREDTVIFDLDRTIQDPENFNWMTRAPSGCMVRTRPCGSRCSS